MNIGIIGASAGLGLRTVNRALEAGHTVTTLSRSTDTLPTNPALRAIAGSALDAGAVARAISGADAVVVTLGTGKSRKPTTLYTDAARVLIAAGIDTAVPVLTVTGFGAGDSAAYQNPAIRLGMKVALGKVYANKTEMEHMLAASSLSWEIVRPGVLTNKPATGRYRVITDYSHGMKVGSISRNDVAEYLVTEAEKQANLGRYPALTN